MQSNSGDVQGNGLNPQQLDTKLDDTFSITQQHTEMAIMGVNVPIGVHGGQANRTWQGLNDANVVDRFLAPYIQTLTMFNTYKLEWVDYTFFIRAVSSSGANYHPGVVLFRALPWTGYYGTDSSTYPVGNPSVLPGCHTWITYNHPNEEQLEQIVYANTAFQRQARFSVTPQYVQDSEPAGTPIPKANFNSALLQIHTTNGRDNTLWRGAVFQLWGHGSNGSSQTQTLRIPYMVRFTISFHGRRWLPATNMLDILGLNFMGRAHEPRGDTTVVSKDGRSCLIDNRESGAPMCSKTQSSQTLDDQDESTDSEVPISITNKGKMLRSSLNPY